MSSELNQNDKSDVVKGFGERLREAFNGRPNSEIARALRVSDSAVTLYIKGRVPSASKLLAIWNLTGCNLHWLLTGFGEKKIKVSKSDTQTLVFQGGKGGVGTTAAAMLSAVVLATKGHRTLLVSNPDNIVPFLFSLNKKSISGFSVRDMTTAESDKYTSTSIQNLEVFTEKGDKFVTHFEKLAESIEKSDFQIKEEYKFIIFDLHGRDILSDKEEVGLKSFLLDGKLIIPYEISNSTIATLDKVLGSLSLGGLLFPSSFLGLFINKEFEKSMYNSKLYPLELGKVQNMIGNKMFKTVIRENSEALQDFIFNTDIEKLKNTQLFEDFSNLIDEILSRLKK